MNPITFNPKYSSLSSFKKAGGRIIRPQSLFGIDWSVKEKGACPICFHRLYVMRNGKLLCKSKKHKGQKIYNTTKNLPN